jgi:hypothetical protein
MNTTRTNRDRINELKKKIFYAEIARENYRKTHAMLYETNSFYVDTLKAKLAGLETQGG